MPDIWNSIQSGHWNFKMFCTSLLWEWIGLNCIFGLWDTSVMDFKEKKPEKITFKKLFFPTWKLTLFRESPIIRKLEEEGILIYKNKGEGRRHVVPYIILVNSLDFGKKVELWGVLLIFNVRKWLKWKRFFYLIYGRPSFWKLLYMKKLQINYNVVSLTGCWCR